MKILIYALNYTPEWTGAGKYTGEMADWLAAMGYEVRVVTTPPYYPHWQINPEYRAGRYRVERSAGRPIPTVYRCPLWVPAAKGGVERMLHLSSFALSSFPVVLRQALWRPDIVFTVEPTFFVAPVALLTAAVCGAASWLHVQDFEIDAAFQLKLLQPSGRMHPLAKGLEKFITGFFTRVSTVSEKMVERIKARGHAPARVLLFPNWSDVEQIKPAAPDAANSFREELGLVGKIVLLYSGNMGEKQRLTRTKNVPIWGESL